MSTASPDPQDHENDQDDEIQPLRQRGPATYDVFRFTDQGHWDLVGEEIEATNRRNAIREACKHSPVDEQFGRFMVTRSNEIAVLTREKKVIPETIADDWS